MEQGLTNKTVMAKNYGQKVHYRGKSLLFSSLIFFLFSCSSNVEPIKWIKIPAGKLQKDSQSFHLKAFEIATTEVTNAQFQQFVSETGYITDAEKDNYGGAVYIDNEWKILPEANWKHPRGKNSIIDDILNHPVVQVTYNDALAYCRWAKVRLPSEKEWEYACLKGNTLQKNINVNHSNGNEIDLMDGFMFTCPVEEFPSNELNVFGMLGNVWEITASPFDLNTHNASPTFVMKGGSFLCDAFYCKGYTPESRQSVAKNDSYFHIGFRVVKD